LQQHHIVADILDQQMVERHLAEFVDDDGGIRERWILEQSIQQCGFAGSEEAGEDGQRYGYRRLSPFGALAGVAH